MVFKHIHITYVRKTHHPKDGTLKTLFCKEILMSVPNKILFSLFFVLYRQPLLFLLLILYFIRYKGCTFFPPQKNKSCKLLKKKIFFKHNFIIIRYPLAVQVLAIIRVKNKNKKYLHHYLLYLLLLFFFGGKKTIS